MNAGCAGKTVRSLENACHTWTPCVHHKALGSMQIHVYLTLPLNHHKSLQRQHFYSSHLSLRPCGKRCHLIIPTKNAKIWRSNWRVHNAALDKKGAKCRLPLTFWRKLPHPAERFVFDSSPTCTNTSQCSPKRQASVVSWLMDNSCLICCVQRATLDYIALPRVGLINWRVRQSARQTIGYSRRPRESITTNIASPV